MNFLVNLSNYKIFQNIQKCTNDVCEFSGNSVLRLLMNKILKVYEVLKISLEIFQATRIWPTRTINLF